MNKLLIRFLILPLIFLIFNLQSPISHLLSPLCYAYPPGWSDDILLTPEDSKSRYSPDVDVDAYNNIWVVWDSATWINGTGEILYSKRDSLGNCLIPEIAVSNNPSYSILSRIAVDNLNNVHFVWRDETPQGVGIWYAKLANDGSVIVPSHLAVSGAGGLGSLIPEIAIDKNHELDIIWDERPLAYNQMNYTKLDSLGDTIISKIQISHPDTSASWPGIGVDSLMNNHLGYRTDSSTVMRLTYTKLDRDGNVLVDNKTVGIGGLPTLISDRNQNIHIVYGEHTTYRNDICYLKLDNDGNILIGPKTISLSQIESNTYSHMAIDSLQYLHIVWQADSSAIVDIMYAKMDTAGNFVIPPMKVVYPQGGGTPRIAVDRSNRLHLVWVSGRLGTPDIFYKRGENEPGVEENARSEASIPNLSVFPNPFTHETKLSFSFSRETERAVIEIFDILGRKVNQFTLDETNGVIRWHGIDASGNSLPSGVYFIRISAIANKRSIPVVLLR
jgi:hypothetical protein